MKGFFYKLIAFGALLIPVVNYPPLFSPPDFGKATLFRIAASLLLAAFIYHCFFHKETDVFRKTTSFIKKGGILLYSPFIILFILFLATIFSVDPLFSMFGDPDRGGGFLTFAAIILFFYVLLFSFDREEWKTAWNVSFFGGALVSLLAILQWLGVSDIVADASSRPRSTMGNPTVLALYLLLLLFPLISFFRQEKERIRKIVYFSLIALFVFVIIITYTRAALLGLFVGLAYLFLFYPGKKPLLRTAAAIVIALSLFSVYYINIHDTPEIVQKNEIMERLSDRLDIENALNDPRTGGFLIGLKAVKEKPVLGYGPENFATAFSKHYYPEAPNISRDIPWWDKAHNLLLEMAVWGGMPAALAMLLLFVSLFLSLYKERNEEKHILQAGVAAFFVGSMFTIDSFSIHLVFFLLVFYIISLFPGEKQEGNLEKRKYLLKYKELFFVVVIPLLLLFIYSFNLVPLLANKDINKANAYMEAGQCSRAIEMAENATQRQTVIDSYLYRNKTNILNECIEKEEVSVKRVYDSMKTAVEKRPLEVRSNMSLVSFITKTLPSMQDREEMIETAKESLEKLYEITPNRYKVHKQGAALNIAINEYKEALKASERCLEIKKEGTCLFMRAASLAALNKEGVKESVEKAKEKGFDTNSTESLEMLINCYAHAENYEEITPLYKKLIEKHPQNAQYHLSLAVTFKEKGDHEKAREYALKVLEIEPLAEQQVKEFIETLN